ncbi:MAG: ROK family protein [Candidatus Entotheonellia bacterium]
MTVLVVDVGGTHIKILATGKKQHRQVESGPTMTAEQMVAAVKQLAAGWRYDRVSIGYPGPVIHDHPLHEPMDMGGGWVGFDFNTAFGHPVKLINDAAMQALGSYKGGHMLFLGLGTGLGSAMVVNSIVQPMELGHLLYKKGRTYEDYLGLRGLKRLGKKRWRRQVVVVIEQLKAALQPDDVVIGGGNAKKLDELPIGCRLGDNANAFIGGFQLWQELRS